MILLQYFTAKTREAVHTLSCESITYETKTVLVHICFYLFSLHHKKNTLSEKNFALTKMHKKKKNVCCCCTAYLFSSHRIASDAKYWTMRKLFVAILLHG